MLQEALCYRKYCVTGSIAFEVVQEVSCYRDRKLLQEAPCYRRHFVTGSTKLQEVKEVLRYKKHRVRSSTGSMVLQEQQETVTGSTMFQDLLCYRKYRVTGSTVLQEVQRFQKLQEAQQKYKRHRT
jgi:hypothetical protein